MSSQQPYPTLAGALSPQHAEQDLCDPSTVSMLAPALHAGMPWHVATGTPVSYTTQWSLEDFKMVNPAPPVVKSQGRSGYCWLYATLTGVEHALSGSLSGPPLSVAYLQYYDTLEKANFFMEIVLQMQLTEWERYILFNEFPTDGGWPGYAANLIHKYGVRLATSYDRSPGARVTHGLRVKLRELVLSAVPTLRQSGRVAKQQVLCQVITLLDAHMSRPPAPTAEETTLSNAAREHQLQMCSVLHHSAGTTGRVQGRLLGNMVGGRPEEFVRCTDATDLLALTHMALDAECPVWVATPWAAFTQHHNHTLDDRVHGDPLPPHLVDKRTRLDECMLYPATHATLIVGRTDGYLLVQNSHGKAEVPPGKGHFRMSEVWFKRYATVIVVPRAVLRAHGRYPLNDSLHVVEISSPMFTCMLSPLDHQ
jgi:aminopeptidase C